MEKCITKETIYAHIPIHLGLFMCHTFILCYFIVYYCYCLCYDQSLIDDEYHVCDYHHSLLTQAFLIQRLCSLT